MLHLRRAIATLDRLLAEAQHVPHGLGSKGFIKWREDVINAVARVYGEGSRQVARVQNVRLTAGAYSGGPEDDRNDALAFAQGFEELQALLHSFRDDVATQLDEPSGLSGESGANTTDPWDLLHPLVVAEARPRFAAGHYADAVEAALKAVNVRVKNAWLQTGREERDGKALMMAAMGSSAASPPVLRLADLGSVSGRDTQEGYMHLFGGAMQAIRNPKAHDNIAISAEHAWLLLALASLLMRKLDDARIP